MTAKEITNQIFIKGKCIYDDIVVQNAMIEFAKYHVSLALKEAAIYAEADVATYGEFIGINRDSILNSYPLENIK